MSDFPDHYLTRDEVHALLREHGFPIGRSTLDKLCMPSAGYKGPPVAALWPDGRHDRPLYTAQAVLGWARSQLKPAPKYASS